MSLAFETLLERLDEKVSEGYKKNASDILDIMPEFSHNYIALKRFVEMCDDGTGDIKLSGTQSFLLARTKWYLVRMNLWTPSRNDKSDMVRQRNDRYMSVGICHNHNFDFFTVGVFGPGYHSKYKHATEDVRYKKIGEPVNFDGEWEVDLGFGDAMFVRRFEDFHTQFAPTAFSITVNLIPHLHKGIDDCQVVLDEQDLLVRHRLMPLESESTFEFGNALPS